MNKALFWDLQGTLGGKAVASIDMFEPYPFSKEALTLAKNNGFINIVITNQSRIGKGTLSLEAYEQTISRIKAYFNTEEILIEDFLLSPYS